VDNRQVVLLKSLRTNNRFYALVSRDSGLKNADAIEGFPEGLLLGIAYPCLEDGLNDFAVIRTTFETIDVFPDDDELRQEMMLIIEDARSNLVRRLEELRDKLKSGQAHFLGTDYQEFKDHILHMAHRGAIRRTLDNMMKLDIFESVSKAEMAMRGGMAEPMFRYEFLAQHDLRTMEPLPPRDFVSRLFDDVLDAVQDDANYRNKYTFDKYVFQKFVAVMFVNYATTEPSFYGTDREDYGVSSDKDMNETPLYQAIGRALRDIERGIPFRRPGATPLGITRTEPAGAPSEDGEDLSFLFGGEGGMPQEVSRSVDIPFGAAERMLLDPLTLLADAVRLLKHVNGSRAPEIRAMVANATQELFRNLQELNILSPLTKDPMDDARD